MNYWTVAVQIIESEKELHSIVQRLRLKKKRIGFVPTMGFLHEGHLSLVRRAKRKSDIVIVSIFVNPTQFGPREDFSRYPRNLKRDCAMLKREKVDFVFIPNVSEMYPNGLIANVNPGPLARGLCGAKRPGHFKGVATVVKRLFEMVNPDVAIFGQKDFQQARVIQDMAKRLKLKAKIDIAPIVRERDGLAMSSRNVYLSKNNRKRAARISATLRFGKQLIAKGERSSSKIEREMTRSLKPFVDKIDYVKVVDARHLRRKARMRGEMAILIACFVGHTRLIDNLLIQV